MDKIRVEMADRWVPTDLQPLWAWTKWRMNFDSRDEGGQSIIEFAVIAGMLVVAAIVIVGVIVTKAKSRVDRIPDTDSIPAASVP